MSVYQGLPLSPSLRERYLLRSGDFGSPVLGAPLSTKERGPEKNIQVRRAAAWAALVAFVLLGCGTRDKPLAAGGGEAVAPLEFKVVDRAGYDAALGELSGKVVLVDFWASWCAPCLEQLPHTTALAEKRRGEGLVGITVAMDDTEAAKRLGAMLASRGGAATINLLSREGGGSRQMEAFEIGGGALPFYKIYDRTGKLRAEFGIDPSAEKQFTTDDVEAAVEKLLAE